MKVLFLSTVHPSAAAPTKGTFNKVLLDALRAEGHEVRAIVPVPWREAGRHALGRVRDTWTARFWYLPGMMSRWLHHALRWSMDASVRRVTDGWTPDVVIGYWAHPDGTVAGAVARTLGVPFVMMVGGTDINVLAKDPTRRATIIATLQSADRVLTIGEALGHQVQTLGVAPARISAFRRGVQTGTFHRGDRMAARVGLQLPPDRPILLWVGRMVAVKGLDILIAAMGLLPPDVAPSLYLVGEGPLRDRLERQAKQAGLGERVIFNGPVAHADLGQWFRAADLIVLPSRTEGVPNVLLEGLGCGTPFVASAVGSIPDLAESSDWLVPPEDPVALAAGIAKALRTPSPVQGEAVDDRGAARRFAALLTETVATAHS